MSPVLLEERTDRFQDVVGFNGRLGVSELARSKAWREKLPKTGCFEIVDHNDTVGYMLAPEYAAALSERIEQLEKELEESNIERLFDLRADYPEPCSGESLKEAAQALFDENAADIRKFLEDDH